MIATTRLESADTLERYRSVRQRTLDLCEPLEVEDFVVQSMTETSPVKWNLAHTTWFFESFILQVFQAGYQAVDPAYAYLFNSYYWAKGERWPRQQRGLLTRPTVRQVMEYREQVDQRMGAFLEDLPEEHEAEVIRRTKIGLHHEQQHQELLLTDLKHALSLNPIHPVYRTPPDRQPDRAVPFEWIDFEDAARSVVTFLRWTEAKRSGVLWAFNFTPTVQETYRVGVPRPGMYTELINTDAHPYGGSDVGNLGGVKSKPIPHNGHDHSIKVALPPLAAVAFSVPNAG